MRVYPRHYLWDPLVYYFVVHAFSWAWVPGSRVLLICDYWSSRSRSAGPQCRLLQGCFGSVSASLGLGYSIAQFLQAWKTAHRSGSIVLSQCQQGRGPHCRDDSGSEFSYWPCRDYYPGTWHSSARGPFSATHRASAYLACLHCPPSYSTTSAALDWLQWHWAQPVCSCCRCNFVAIWVFSGSTRHQTENAHGLSPLWYSELCHCSVSSYCRQSCYQHCEENSERCHCCQRGWWESHRLLPDIGTGCFLRFGYFASWCSSLLLGSCFDNVLAEQHFLNPTRSRHY